MSDQNPYGPPPTWGQAPQQPAPGSGPPAFGPPTSEERNWALASHVGSFLAAYLALGLVAPLIVMLTKGRDSAYVRAHAVESLNWQITTLIYFAVSVVLAFVLIGFLMLAVLGIWYLVVVIIAGVKASNGEFYRYPLSIRLVS